MESLEKQKGDAKRWLSRQQLRLSTQAEEVSLEKGAMADLQEQDIMDFQKLLKRVNQLFDRQQQQQQYGNTTNNNNNNNSIGHNNNSAIRSGGLWWSVIAMMMMMMIIYTH